ncbi:hypothetical protein FRB96_005693 [Tulasnella sp. 330]|nr:hypothetical protein FRB96_005693 [Tulasnella sp. 330]
MLTWDSPPSWTLTPEQKLMYASEKEENFRFILRIAGSRSSYVLTSKDHAPMELLQELSDIGQFTEIAHGSMRPADIWKVLPRLLMPGFPLQGYTYLEGSELVEVFLGTVALVQGYVAYRPQNKQLIISFSGTSSSSQVIADLKGWHVAYPTADADSKGSQVHAGFWQLYSGVRTLALDALKKGLETREVSEVIITGHSMGGVLSYLFTLDMLDTTVATTLSFVPGTPLTIVVLGSPRAGNKALVACWRKRLSLYRNTHGQDRLKEWSVRAYQDGVPALPNAFMGYRHFAEAPLYLYHGRLYHIPQSEIESTIFTVTKENTDPNALIPPDYPLGGHNYYGGRDMEKLQRLMRLAHELGLGNNDDWEAAFLQRTATKDASRKKSHLARERWKKLGWRLRHQGHSWDREDHHNSLDADGAKD